MMDEPKWVEGRYHGIRGGQGYRKHVLVTFDSATVFFTGVGADDCFRGVKLGTLTRVYLLGDAVCTNGTYHLHGKGN